ncbi:MAG: cupin domain-containing protein [Solirubrobacteraceae bacterium]|nr:cupin domain-containing protein [Solirubrobacteraceae bacterium]
MSGPTVIPPGGGEVVGDSPDRRVEILCDHERLHVTWSRFAAGRDGADLHVHRHHADHFYVLDGELTIRLEDREVAVPAGTFARVPPMVIHGFRNASDADVRYLNLHAPGEHFAQFMRGLRDGFQVPEYDQHDPPDEGIRPPSEASLTSGGGVLCDHPELTVQELALAPGTTLTGFDACFALDASRVLALRFT